MARGNSTAIVNELRRLLRVGGLGTASDRDLLERFATGDDEAAEAAFEVLIVRHGPMVLRVCQGVLNDPSGAEDAFQATFILLIRRAESLWVRDSLGPWLHGVALRVANKARVAAARRRASEGRAIGRSIGNDHEGQAEIVAVVHEELGRLPEKYRVPVVLCHLEGLSHEEAARSLDWPVGTVRGRLSRGRDLLRSRLARRGFAPSTVAMGVLFGSDQARAVSHRLMDAVIRVATKVRTGGLSGLVPETIVLLIKEEGRTMLLTKFKMTGTMLLAGALVVGAGAMADHGDNPTSKGEDRAKFAPPAAQETSQPTPGLAGRSTEAESAKLATRKPDVDDEADRLIKIIVDGEAGAAIVEQMAPITNAERMALEALLKKYNYGVPKDFDHEISTEETMIAEQCAKARRRLEEIVKDNVEMRSRVGISEMAAIRLSKLYPGLIPGPGQAAPIPAPSSDHETRLNNLEKKLDRVLDALESLKREPKR
jgi:RNA polymerase sigma factor (sigma-70 family)